MNEMISPSTIYFDHPAKTKGELLAFVAHQAFQNGISSSEAGLLQDLENRENEISTGLQDGFAIPHAKSRHVLKPAVMFVRTKEPIPWETLDGSPVSCVFSLLVPEVNEGNLHLKMLSKLAVNLMDEDFKSSIASSQDPDKLAAFILAAVD